MRRVRPDWSNLRKRSGARTKVHRFDQEFLERLQKVRTNESVFVS